MLERSKLTVGPAHTVLNIFYLRDRDEREFLLMMSGMRRDLDDSQTLCFTRVAYFLLNAPYASISFFSWSKMRRRSILYKLRYRVSGIDGESNFVWWRNCELFRAPPYEPANLDVQLSGW